MNLKRTWPIAYGKVHGASRRLCYTPYAISSPLLIRIDDRGWALGMIVPLHTGMFYHQDHVEQTAHKADDEGAPEGRSESDDGKAFYKGGGQLQQKGIDHHHEQAE